MPSFSTLSRSTSTKTCGTDALNGELTAASSGRLRAAARNCCSAVSSVAMSPPDRSCSQKLKPPCEPRPGIAGGMLAIATPSGISARKRALSWLTMARAPSSRSCHGSRPTKKNALFGAVTRVATLKPTMALKPKTPGVFARIASTLRATASVRCSDAAGGSCTLSRK